jgi:hypothetical protein
VPLSSRTTDREFYRQLAVQIASLVEIHVPSVTIVGGDFNAHLFNPKKDYDREFVWLCEQWRADAFVRGPSTERPFSYVSGKSTSTIDYAFFRGVDLVSCTVGPIYIAQHRPLLATFSLPPNSVPGQRKALGTAYWKSRARQEDFPSAIHGLGSIVSNNTPFLLQSYVDRFYNVLQIYTKRRPKKIRVESWETFLSVEDRRILNSARDEVDEWMSAADTDPCKRDKAQEKRKSLEHLTTRLMRSALETESAKLAETSSSHTDAWRVLAKLRGSANQCPIPTARLMDHFADISKPSNCPLLPKPIEPTAVLHMDPLTPDELESALHDVNQSAAAGPDGISPKLMCQSFASGVQFEFLFNLMAMCLVLAYVPLQWREATMFVLYKGTGDPGDPNSYRAISLTSAFGKLLERLLLRRLLAWLRNSRIWLLPQFGFRSGSSCVHAIFLLRTLTADILDSTRRPVFLAFVDLRKAFPSLGRDALFERMLRLGIPYPLVSAIRAFYISNVARLRVDDTLTRDFFVAVGVLEGSVLSPCLFGILFSVVWDLVATSDFPTPVMKVYNDGSLWLIAYADDLVVIALSRTRLEEVLNTLSRELKTMNLQMR